MAFDFELFLTCITFLSGIAWLIDAQVFAPKRRQAHIDKMPLWAEYARSFFPVLLLVLLLRSFIVEPYRIPTGSDIPTLLVGDFLVANKFTYGLRLPVLHTKIWQINEPKTGDIALFRYPVDPSQDFIKRIIGVPGDRISYVNKELYLNGQPAPQQFQGTATDGDSLGHQWAVEVRQETLAGIKHNIYIRNDIPAQDFSVVVPPGQYFAMGENRDDSNDSRYWGFVPEENFVGKAFIIFFSWDKEHHRVRWDRIGRWIH